MFDNANINRFVIQTKLFRKYFCKTMHCLSFVSEKAILSLLHSFARYTGIATP
jgi:hypothetical protein